MADFQYYTPTRVAFGRGGPEKTGALAKQAGAHKVLLHYGGGSAVRSGVLARVEASLRAAGIEVVTLGGAVPNPRLSLVREGIALCLREGVDLLVAVGGGSTIDSAKAMAYGAAEPDKDVWELYEHTRRPAACLPLGAVVTIAAAGSEMSDSSVITKDEGGVKRGCNSDLCRPRFAVMDPELTLTLPAYQTACGCTDIMMHTMERYFVSGPTMQLTDALAEGLLRTVMANARVLQDDPQNYDARAEVLWASSLSHNGLTGCGITQSDFACHGLEHELGGRYDIAHGAGLAAVWGSWARYVYRDCLPRFAQFAVRVMGVPDAGGAQATALRGIETLESFFRSIGMPTSLRELGITPTEADLDALARGCALAAGGKKGSARVLYEADMRAIYAMAR